MTEILLVMQCSYSTKLTVVEYRIVAMRANEVRLEVFRFDRRASGASSTNEVAAASAMVTSSYNRKFRVAFFHQTFARFAVGNPKSVVLNERARGRCKLRATFSLSVDWIINVQTLPFGVIRGVAMPFATSRNEMADDASVGVFSSAPPLIAAMAPFGARSFIGESGARLALRNSRRRRDLARHTSRVLLMLTTQRSRSRFVLRLQSVLIQIEK